MKGTLKMFTRWQIAVVLVACSTFATPEADAGVTGNRYTGFVLVDGSIPPNVVGETMDFRTNGTFTAIENQQSGTFTFNGTFTETNLGFISTWSAVVNDGSPDGKGFFDGVSFFGGFLSTVISSNDVGHSNQPIAHGIIFKTGSAQRSAQVSGSSDGTVGGPAE
ncbi:MAG: hypothetical protein B7Z55_07550 [Planctomycetales bacterium 12-60-4]|nr:MAG: hypothetical protein B7Z55_07550 [Planctomycetales bacterium 12-60-4]